MSIFKTGLGALTAAALVLTATSPAAAGSAITTTPQTKAMTAGTSGATDFSAQRRYRGGGGGAAAAAAFAGIVGTAIAVGAARNYDDGYYAGGPRYYGSPYDSYNSYGGSYGYGGYARQQDVSPGYGWDDPRNHNVNR